LGAQLLGMPTPFTAIQILWINIIMDGPPAMTLGLEPARPGIMNEAPRSTEARILTLPRFWRLLAYGAIMATGTIGVFFYGLQTGGQAYALTLAFTTFVLFQFFNVFNARTEHGTAFNRQFFANGKLWSALIGVVGLQVVVVHWGPAQEIFRTTDISASDWSLTFAVAASVLLFEEARKLLQRLWNRQAKPDAPRPSP
ncbi:MAG: cation-translocating P-type ATPase C-terminal domain-containing protein, partial [Sulfuricella sp.]|nr:cation-translocating P-type ATPase C-terminal domain-containing protein [Sulfuricella sp.]